MGKQRIVTLTDRPPVLIDEDDWPRIAWGHGDSYGPVDPLRHDQEVDVYDVVVRRHADGRHLVYAVLGGAKAWTGTASRREGELLAPGEDVVAAIRRVGARCGIPDRVIRDCIADLPPDRL